MRIMKRFIFLLALCLCGGCIYGQAPTKEQLLKLFFQAHKACLYVLCQLLAIAS